ncbi:MAG TPA: putative glycoside hydrolase [Terriglobales bacterium]
MKIASFLPPILLLAALAPLCAQIAQPPVVARHPTSADSEIRAIYFTGLMAGSPHGKQIAEQWRAEGGNAIVFDIKDSDGPVSFNSNLPLAGHMKRPYVANLAEWVSWLHAHGLYVIARQAVFKDQRLVEEHPELAVHSRSTSGSWIENHKLGKATWTDPSLPAVQNYNIALAREVADAGVDEIQFDYIRFPVDGNQKDARFAYQEKDPSATRADFISNYLYRAHEALKPTGVHISIDVYGVMAWSRQEDLNATGQDVVSLAYFCDVMCPMIYPSHFFGNFDGISDPGDAPQHFIQAGMEKFNGITQDTGVHIRPWLQAFAWRTKTFGVDYILIQVETERAQHGAGFMLWNANNRYAVPDKAMPLMVSGGAKYFQGGFPYGEAKP